MQWNTLPAKLQRELFDNAGDMGELLDTSALRGQIARFLHTHKNDESNGGDKDDEIKPRDARRRQANRGRDRPEKPGRARRTWCS